MTLEELSKRYGFGNPTVEELMERQKSGQVLNPIYEKHLPACWVIQSIWGHVENGNISLGKARELTAAVIEEHFKAISNDPEESKVND